MTASTSKQEFVLVDGTPTYVLKQGEIRQKNDEEDVLMLIIPGNPGVADYYDVFMESLHQASNKHIPVWCLSHAGHVTLPAHVKASTSDDLCSLQGQIRHKVHFINNYIPATTKLILIGHSIGCYIILRMLEHLDPSRVLKCWLLFPTIEKIGTAPKGRYTVPLLKYFRWLGPWLMYPVSYFVPASTKYGILKWYFGKKNCNVPGSAIDATTKIVDPLVFGRITEMAHEEMQTVVDADHDVIRKNLGKLMFYYGSKDHWCPVEYYEEMKKTYPEAEMYLCREGFEHAFVLESGAEMAQWLWQWLEENICLKSVKC